MSLMRKALELEEVARSGPSVRLPFSAFRTPLLLLMGLALANLSDTFIPNLVSLFNYFSSPQSVNNFARWRADKLLYISNVVIFLGCLVGAFALLEVKRFLVPRNKSVGGDIITVLFCFGFALVAPMLSISVGGGLGGSLRAAGLQAALIWVFMIFNSNLYVFDRYLASKRWGMRLLDWTFPVTDIGFYMFHRERLGTNLGWVRLVPSFTYVLVLLLGLGVEGHILWEAIPAEKMNIRRSDGLPVPIMETNWVEWSDGGFWFSNSNWADKASGLWYYDDASSKGYSYIQILDLKKFPLDDGFFYFYDRVPSEVVKVNAQTWQINWRVPIRSGFGTVELAPRNSLIFAAGENGFITVINKDGQVLAERTFPHKTEDIQALIDERLAFLNGDTNVRILKADLSDSEILPLPLPEGVLKLEDSSGGSRLMRLATWTQLDERSNTLYVATFWGQIFRYDYSRRQWLQSLKARPGVRSFSVDSQNGLVFVANYYGGYIEVLELKSGKVVKYILAGSLSRYINLNPSKKIGILNTKGWGMYRFDYSDIVPPVSVSKN